MTKTSSIRHNHICLQKDVDAAKVAAVTWGQLHLLFKSKIQGGSKAPKSMPWSELCAALAGAQLCTVLHRELTLSTFQAFLWTTLRPFWCSFHPNSAVSKFSLEPGCLRFRNRDHCTHGSMWLQVPNKLIISPTVRPCLKKQQAKKVKNGCRSLYWFLKLEEVAFLKKGTFCGLMQTGLKHKLVRPIQHCIHGPAADSSTPQYDFRLRYFCWRPARQMAFQEKWIV